VPPGGGGAAWAPLAFLWGMGEGMGIANVIFPRVPPVGFLRR